MSDLSGHSSTDPDDTTLGSRGAVGYQSDWQDDGADYTETKAFFRTSEFWFIILGIVAVLLTAYSEGQDSITRDDGWRYATLLTVAYAISRGLAKAGTKEPTD
ncbi:MAG: hypothetical protein H0X61_13645 [Acidimicrobiia bacterium]|jgi:hypothetical protein|nr:hypothetical protein [Acidimicrobiia bacterium]